MRRSVWLIPLVLGCSTAGPPTVETTAEAVVKKKPATPADLVVSLGGKLTRRDKDPRRTVIGINLSGAKVGDLAFLKDFPELETLELAGTRGHDALEPLRALKHLRILDLSRTTVSAAGIEKMIGLPALRQLYLDQCPGIDDAALEQLGRLTDLELVAVEDTPITDQGLRHVGQLRKLHTLMLDRCKITDQGIAQLTGLTELRSLGLGHTGISDASLERLKDLTQLSDLTLTQTKISDAGVAHLGSLNLEEINLRQTPITDAALKHIEGMPRLRQLDVRGTKVTPAGIKRLRILHPKAEIRQ
jgi:Leucine-rich repeat (LRR) protein